MIRETAQAGNLLNDRDLRSFDLERLEFAGASLWVLGGHRIAHNAGWRVVGYHPFGDKEVPFRLFLGLSIAHSKINGLPAIGQVDHELRRTIPLASRRIDGGHAESHGLTPFEVIIQYAVSGIAGRVEVDHVAVYNQVIGTRWRLPGNRPGCCDCDQRNQASKRGIFIVTLHIRRSYVNQLRLSSPILLIRDLHCAAQNRLSYEPLEGRVSRVKQAEGGVQ
jgi:hypothetical protein